MNDSHTEPDAYARTFPDADTRPRGQHHHTDTKPDTDTLANTCTSRRHGFRHIGKWHGHPDDD